MDFVILFIILPIYFIPTIVANNRAHCNSTPIALLNLLLGWSFVGWVIALVWATTNNTDKNVKNVLPLSIMYIFSFIAFCGCAINYFIIDPPEKRFERRIDEITKNQDNQVNETIDALKTIQNSYNHSN